MGVYEIEVGVALRRPPRTDEIRKYLIVAERAIEAEILACQWAACTSVMPVFSRLVVCDPECTVDPDYGGRPASGSL